MGEIESLYEIFEKNEYRYSTDSRNIHLGDIFFCLVGEKFDANLFAEEALGKGAKLVITNREDLRNKDGYFFTTDTLVAFQELSKFHAAKMPAKKIIIGGSNGKTTTKELVHCVLSDIGETHVTAGNFNNHIGVPITLLGIRSYHKFAVIEMGTNHPGEMNLLCSMVVPDLGLITNIGKEHLEGFGDIEAVAREESEVYLRCLECNAAAVVNTDDSWLNSMSKRLKNIIKIHIQSEIHTSVSSANNDAFSASIIQEMPHLQLTLLGNGQLIENCHFNIAGSYNAYNILFGLAVGFHFGRSVEDCLNSMKPYSPKNNRSEWRKIGNTSIFLDAYNANPSSMEAAIRSFNTLTGEKIYFLGDMLELGDHSKAEHLHLLDLLRELNIEENAYLVGNEFYTHCTKYPLRFTDTSSLLAWLDTHPIKADYIFVKGSRGVKMETVLEHFQN